MSKKRNQYSVSFKSKIALAALKIQQTTSEVAARLHGQVPKSMNC